MKDSLGREPRWNADRCAPPDRGRGRARQARLNTNCVCRRFASDIFSFVLSPSVMPGLDPGIHAEVTLEKRFPPSVCLRHVSMDHRIKSGGDDSESDVA
jgi:hypothetical protein